MELDHTLLLVMLWVNLRGLPVRSYIHAKRSLKVVTGDQVELECHSAENGRIDSSSELEGLLRLQWTRDEATIASYNQAAHVAEWWVASPRYVLDRFTFRLTVYNTQLDDSGVYRCRPHFRNYNSVWKNHDTDDLTELVVIGPPTAPGRAIITAHTSRTATVSWESSQSHQDAPVIQYIIVVSVGKDGKKDVYKEVFSTGKRTTKLVASLYPYTIYTFHIIAENIAGKSVPGEASYPIRTKGEAPVSPPKIRYAYNATNSSVVITWDHPPAKSLHGPLIGYRIIARPQSSLAIRREYYVNQPDINSFELTGLALYTSYAVSLEADNTYGYSPADTISILTQEGTPLTAPEIIRATSRSSNTVELSWNPPSITGGQITMYTIYIRPESKASELETNSVSIVMVPINNSNAGRIKINNAREILMHAIENLNPFTKYFFSISASTQKGEGLKSETVTAQTDTDAPGTPLISNISIYSQNVGSPAAVFLEWIPPNSANGFIDMYTVQLETDEHSSYHNASEPNAIVGGLKSGVKYFSKVRGITNSLLVAGKFYISDYSPEEIFYIEAYKSNERTSPALLHTTICPESIVMNSQHKIARGHPNQNANEVGNAAIIYCEESLRSDFKQPVNESTAGKITTVFAATACLILIFLLILAFVYGVFICKKCRRKTKPYQKENCYHKAPSLGSGSTGTSEIIHTNNGNNSEIAATDFPFHVKQLHQNDNAGFAKEYDIIDNMSVGADEYKKITCEYSSLSENKSKNRYVNILAYDHSRVILRTIPGTPGSDYINGNYVDGFNHPKAYIATQGPLPNTYGHFWRMIWEQRCLVIVMITNIVERGKKKCDQYWPNSNNVSETYDWFQIRVVSEANTAFFTVRMISVKNLRLKRKAERIVFHYQYKNWPDHDVPDQILPVLSFIRKSSAANRDNNGPIVVHCSAGVGRSGTYIVIDSMLKQVKAKGTLNVFAFLKHIRTQRNYLVQTEDQYIFCHDALVEAILSGETEIGATDLPDYIAHRLLVSVEEDNAGSITELKKQFDLINCVNPGTTEEARRPSNANKNRSLQNLPVDGYHIQMASQDNEESSYINATILPGHHRPDEYIVTQFPTEKTTSQFWQMIWNYQTRTIVLLCAEDSTGDFAQFWPEPMVAFLSCSDFDVYQTRCETGTHWAVRDFILQTHQDSYQVCCRMVSCPHWLAISRAEEEVFDLIDAVQDWHYQFNDNSPIVVVDRHGGTEAATFCALSTVSCQLEQDSTVDIYQIVKLYAIRRTSLFPKIDDYYLLYRAANALCLADFKNYPENTGINSVVQRRLRNEESRLSLCNAAKTINCSFTAKLSPSIRSISSDEMAQPFSVNEERTVVNGMLYAESDFYNTTPKGPLHSATRSNILPYADSASVEANTASSLQNSTTESNTSSNSWYDNQKTKLSGTTIIMDTSERNSDLIINDGLTTRIQQQNYQTIANLP